MIKIYATVRKAGVSCSSYGAYLPCKRWNDFRDNTVDPSKMTGLTTSAGALDPGTYVIEYKVVLNHYKKKSELSRTTGRHTFSIERGCETILPSTSSEGGVENSELSKYILLSADDFVRAPCDKLHDVSESIFRKYDTNPTDGVLDYDEIDRAIREQGGDRYILKVWNQTRALRLSLGHFMKANVVPHMCASSESAQSVSFEGVVYPSTEAGRETTRKDCAQNAKAMSVDWKYGPKNPPKSGDTVCVFVDGVLFQVNEPKSAAPPNSNGHHSKVAGLYTLTKVTDKRPVVGAIGDVQPSLVAQFTFDTEREIGNTVSSDRIFSAAPLASGQKARPYILYSRRPVSACSGASGGKCITAHGGGFKYVGDALGGAVAFSAWVRVASSSATTLIEFSGTNGQLRNSFTLVMDCLQRSVCTLRASYGHIGVDGKKLDLAKREISELSLSQWVLVGFTLSHNAGLKLFALSDGSTATKTASDPSWPKDTLPKLPNIKFFAASSGGGRQHIDDVRLYTGIMDMEMFLSARDCGRSTVCAMRAHATPSHRRVVCVLTQVKGAKTGQPACVGGLYYDGTAIDIRASMDLAGVVFEFRDTAWEEKSFEIERRAPVVNSKFDSKFDTVVLIEGGLKGCAAKFSSITYMDRDASYTPYAEWLYRITTKNPDSDDANKITYLLSSQLTFRTPWMSQIEGRVLAGASTEGVRNVRMCAEFDTFVTRTPVSEDFQDDVEYENLAAFKSVTHSNGAQTSTSYVVTDGEDAGESNNVDANEYIRIDLGGWVSVSSVDVCHKRPKPSVTSTFGAYVQDYDPGKSTYFGHECLVDESVDVGQDSDEHACLTYTCKGTDVNSFHGQYVTVKALTKAKVTEIKVNGRKTRCKYTAVTGDDGEYAMDLEDTSGKVPVKATLHIGAYKEEIFPETTEVLIDSKRNAQGQYAVPKSQAHNVLLILRENFETSELGKFRNDRQTEILSSPRASVNGVHADEFTASHELEYDEFENSDFDHFGVDQSEHGVFDQDGGNETAAALGDDDDAALGVRYGCDETLRGWRNEGYRGCQSKTRSGRTCQSWDRQWPHRHSRRKCHKGSCGNNYCRNPDGEPTIWCYTTDRRKRWEYCSPLPRPVHCSGYWSGWTSCSPSCTSGNRYKYRYYKITRYPKYGGRSCPYRHYYKQSARCSSNPCPVNCYGGFGSWSTCDAKCGWGKQQKTFKIYKAAKYGGRSCSHGNGYKQTRNCYSQHCPPPPPSPPPPGAAKVDEFIEWVLLKGTKSNGKGHIERTQAGRGWNAGAVSKRAIRQASDTVRGISAVCSETNRHRMIALNSQSTADSITYKDLDFALYCRSDGRVRIYEKGRYRNVQKAYGKDAVIQIALNDAGKVEYFLNGLRLMTSDQKVTYPLHADVSIYEQGASLENVRWARRVSSPPPPPPPSPPPSPPPPSPPPPSPPPPSPPPPNHVLEDVDFDGSGNVTRSELVDYIEAITISSEGGHVIITDDVWAKLDRDEDGVLDETEFKDVANRIVAQTLVVEPILVFPLQDTQYMYDFNMLQTSDDATNSGPRTGHMQENGESCENLMIVRSQSAALPFGNAQWTKFYETLRDEQHRFECRDLSKVEVPAIEVGAVNSTYIIPVLAHKNGTNYLVLDTASIATHTSNETKLLDMMHRMTRDNFRLRVQAQKRLPDILHSFNKPPVPRDASPEVPSDEGIVARIFSDQATLDRVSLSVKHKRVEEKDFTDDTTVIVNGAVLFPKDLVEQSTDCGLFKATIEVFEPEGEVEEYFTDERGFFKFALTRGKTFNIRPKYKNHTLCYAGSTIESAVEDVRTCEGRSVVKTLPNVQDGNFVFFSDVTRGVIDLGLYHGECEQRYSGAVFKVTPINGCHAPKLVKSEEIEGWNVANTAVAEDAKFWPFAAMDYSIMLLSGPDVNGIQPLIKGEPWADGCGTEPGSMVTFFRSRNALERIAPMRDDYDLVTIRYKYHGFICVEILDIPKIRDPLEVCYDPNEADGNLTIKHFLGTSNSEDLGGVGGSIRLQAKVFELHLDQDAGKPVLSKCFEALPNKEAQTGSTLLSFRQSVTDEDDNECHPNRGGGPSCDFDTTIEPASELVIWNEEGDTSVEVVAGKPNLAGNHRRTVEFTIKRFDTYKLVTAYAKRELIPLGSKPRGEGLFGPDSDDIYWATVPLEGLVYTVVHDPPGGLSYAELSTGSQIGLQFDLVGKRMASEGKGGASKKQLPDIDKSIDVGFNAGWVAEGSLTTDLHLIKTKGAIKTKTEGPTMRITSSEDKGWGLETTTQRTIRSSKDAGTPGRAGDVILGGGIELVYKISDILDIVNDARTLKKPCLYVYGEITWLPRKPTSYIMSVASIETQVVPNLYYLRSLVKEGGIAADGSEMLYDCDSGATSKEMSKCTKEDQLEAWMQYLDEKIDLWRRTLEWSSPKVFNIDEGGEKKKYYDAIERITKPASDGGFMHTNYQVQVRRFKEAYETPIKDVIEEVGSAWDSSFFMMPFNGIGPPPFFDDPTGIGGLDWILDSRYWEYGDGDTSTYSRIHGTPPWTESPLRVAADSMSQVKPIGMTAWNNYNAAKKLAARRKAAAAAVAKMQKQKQSVKKAASKFKSLSKSAKSAGPAVKKSAGLLTRAKKAATKAAKTTAGQVVGGIVLTAAVAGAAAGAVALAPAMDQMGYKYVAYPREYYEDGIPTFEENFFDDDFDVLSKGDQAKDEDGMRGAYTWGMFSSATKDLLQQFQSCAGRECKPNEIRTDTLSESKQTTDFGEDYLISNTPSSPDATRRVVASFTGGQASTGMKVTTTATDGVADKGSLLLTFSGGGHTADYSFSSNEKIADLHYSLGVQLSAKQSNKYKIELGGLIGTIVQLAMALGGVDDEAVYTFQKSFDEDRTFAWNRHASLKTLYSLGDAQVGDKFVVQVGEDVRFGTPVFITKGGRSACPGEPLTMFRQAGFSLSKETSFNENLNPEDRALLRLKLTNESPYKETFPLGLRIVDGLAMSVHKVIQDMYEALTMKDVTGSDILKAVDKSIASLAIGKDNDVIKTMKENARVAVEEHSATPTDVAAVVVQASRRAPRKFEDLQNIEFSVSGKKAYFGDILPLKFADAEDLHVQKRVLETSFALAVKATSPSSLRLEHLAVVVVSLCEQEIRSTSKFGREPIGTNTLPLGLMTWSQKCPQVAFDGSTVADYLFSSVSSAAPKPLKLTVFNPDGALLWPGSSDDARAINPNLRFVRLQYRPASGGEWITAKSEDSDPKFSYKKNLLCDGSRLGGCTFDWDVNNQYEKLLSGFKDNIYELRLKNFCFGTETRPISALADSTVHEYVSDQILTLRVDTKTPIPGKTYPAFQRFYTVEFPEAIDCSNQKVAITKKRTSCGDDGRSVNQAVSEEAIKAGFDFQCSNNEVGFKWMIGFPNTEVGQYAVEVSGVRDEAGNDASPFTFVMDANCAPASQKTSLARFSLGAMQWSAEKTGDAPTTLFDVPVASMPSAWILAGCCLVAGVAIFAGVFRRWPHIEDKEKYPLSFFHRRYTSYGAVV